MYCLRLRASSQPQTCGLLGGFSRSEQNSPTYSAIPTMPVRVLLAGIFSDIASGIPFLIAATARWALVFDSFLLISDISQSSA